MDGAPRAHAGHAAHRAHLFRRAHARTRRQPRRPHAQRGAHRQLPLDLPRPRQHPAAHRQLHRVAAERRGPLAQLHADNGPFGRGYGRFTPTGRSAAPGTPACAWSRPDHRLDAVGVPDTLLFRAGGDDSVRGYAYRTLGPLVDGVVTSGRVMATGSAEIARPIRIPCPRCGGRYSPMPATPPTTGRISRRPGVTGSVPRWRSPVGRCASTPAMGSAQGAPASQRRHCLLTRMDDASVSWQSRFRRPLGWARWLTWASCPWPRLALLVAAGCGRCAPKPARLALALGLTAEGVSGALLRSAGAAPAPSCRAAARSRSGALAGLAPRACARRAAARVGDGSRPRRR